MRYIVALFVAIATAFSVAIGQAQEPTPTPTPEAPQTYWEANGCKTVVKRDDYIKKLKSVYAYSHHTGKGGNYIAATVTRREREKLARMRECSSSREAHKNRLERTQKRRDVWAFHVRIDRITDHGEFAIPFPVVNRESGTSGWYRAYNDPPDGCSGNGCIGHSQIDATWFDRGCAQFLRYGNVWNPAVQHLCTDYIERVQGPSAWAQTW